MRQTRVDASIAVAAGVLGAIYRFLAHTTFNNDQFVHLARAQAWLAGDWPIRDYEEPGALLTVGVSAAAQAMFGQTLLPELLLSIVALGVAAAVTCWLVTGLTGSRGLGVFAAVLQIAILPRLYSYPKILLYPVAIVLLGRYITGPTLPRLAGAALFVAISFLLRQDHGVYIAAAVALTVAAAHWRDGAGVTARRLATAAALCIAFLLPFLIYVQSNLGLWRYFQLGIGTYQGEASRTRITLPTFRIVGGPLFIQQPPEADDLPRLHIRWAAHVDEGARLARERAVPLLHPEHLEGRTWRYRVEWNRTQALAPVFAGRDVEDVDGIDRRTLTLEPTPSLRERVLESLSLRGWRFGPPLVSVWENAPSFLFYSAWILPCAALLIWVRAGERRAPIIPIVCALALMGVAGFQRDQPAIRAPDVFGTFPILFAWVLSALVSVRIGSPRSLSVTAAVVLAVLVSASVAWLGGVRGQLSRTGLFEGPRTVVRRAMTIVASAHDWPWSAQWPGDQEWKVARYVHDCTRPGDRLLVTWFAPQFNVFSRRPFVGRETVLMPAYRDPSTYEKAVLDAWTRQRVPFVLVEQSTYASFAAVYPALAEYMGSHYRQVGAMPSRSDMILVYAERGRDFTRTDAELGWECLANR